MASGPVVLPGINLEEKTEAPVKENRRDGAASPLHASLPRTPPESPSGPGSPLSWGRWHVNEASAELSRLPRGLGGSADLLGWRGDT